MKKIILILIILLPLTNAFAQPGFNARSMSMAGAYHGMARGADVSYWNPANLLLPNHPYVTADLLNFGFTVGNNILSVDFYNEYFSTEFFDTEDKYWSEADKNEIISYFDEGFDGNFRGQFTFLAGSYEQFALAINHFAYSNIHLQQDFVVVPLQGLSTEPVIFDDNEAEGVVGTEIAFSMAKALHPDWDFIKFLSVGATLRYFIGHAYFRLEDSYGYVQSSTDSLKFNGYYDLLIVAPFEDKGKTGDGVGFDLGAAAKVSDQLTLGLSFVNLVGFINFGEVELQHADISYNEPGLNIDNFDDFGDFIEGVAEDSITDYSYTTDAKYALPKSMIMSANYRYNWWLTVEADYQQGLNNTAGGSTTPRLALGVQAQYVRWLPVRCGFALGGYQGTTFAFGFGLDFRSYQFDFGIAAQRGLFNKSKGVNFAISHRLEF